MEKFLSCDWGSASFRLRLIDGAAMTVIAQELTTMGILRMNENWQKLEDQPGRREHYLAYLKSNIDVLEARTGESLDGLPVVLSGMASSALGIEEIPYGNLPFALKDGKLPVKRFEASEDFNHPLWLVSGLQGKSDLLRGEEIQLMGLLENSPEMKSGLFIFPGSYSIHIELRDGVVENFRTFLTGELFSLLTAQSILSLSVEKHQQFSPDYRQAFSQGVQAAGEVNILHALFLVRTQDIFGEFNHQENYSYLSGLLIATELAGLRNSGRDIFLCCNSELRPWYELAFEMLGISQPRKFSSQEIDAAIARGHQLIYQQQKIGHE